MDLTQVKVTKLKEADKPLHPDNIEVGYERTGQYSKPPQVGERFFVGYGWATSTVQEILTANTFRTHNSVYKWEVIMAAPKPQETEFLTDFEKAVIEMRNLQKAYFKTCDRAILEQSKAAERKVDAYIKQKTDPSLF